jgi:hypothetical protein
MLQQLLPHARASVLSALELEHPVVNGRVELG